MKVSRGDTVSFLALASQSSPASWLHCKTYWPMALILISLHLPYPCLHPTSGLVPSPQQIWIKDGRNHKSAEDGLLDSDWSL